MRSAKAFIGAGAAALLSAGAAMAEQHARPSFDCARAATPVEKEICGGETLADLDRVVDALFRATHGAAAPEPRRQLESDQRRWLASRDAQCGRIKSMATCLERAYRERAAALARKAHEHGALKGGFMTGTYDYRDRGLSGTMFIAEMSATAAYVTIETVTTNRPSPHQCGLANTFERRGDALFLRHSERKPACMIRIRVTGARATIDTVPNDCHEGQFEECGAMGTFIGPYRRR